MATVKVWDIAVRVFHWSLVAAFATAYLTGDENEFVHVYAGYIVLGLVAFRVVWGFIGTKHARFTDFIYSPGKIFAYARSLASGSPKHYLGHNPLGGVMVIALLISLSLTCASGLKLYAVEEGKGPLAGEQSLGLITPAYAHEGGNHANKDKKGEDTWEEIHELFVNLTLGLVVLHIAGVVVSSVLHKEKLVKAMITGNKDA
ncbi:MAG TPA: cytochrome b/b6 domain-containing protein [Spongiibacteraceae bacterium]|nr:cytochrome b/b6 domain-containing protein [Spongiibacteraceae bacterium]